MSIKKLKKITVYGLASEKDSILSGLQETGCVHLIPLTESQAGMEGQLTEPQAAKEALSWLNSCPVKRREIRRKDAAQADDVVNEVLANKAQHREASDHRDDLIARIHTVRPWGEINFTSVDDMDGMRLWFYVLPYQDAEALEVLEVPHQIIHRDQQNIYVVLLSREEPAVDVLPVKRSHIGEHSLSTLEKMLEDAEVKLEDIQGEREALTRWTYVLDQAIARREDRKALDDAHKITLDDDQFFLVSGWMPVDEEARVRAFIDPMPAAMTLEDPAADDQPPTLLDKPASTGGGADALGFFQMPNYRAWDPGNLVFYSFSLFFAMIMSDAMYSAVLGGIIFMFRGKFKQSEAGSRLMNLAYFMAALGIIWGVFIGSYFGAAPAEDSLLGKLAFINLNDYGAMMKLSIIIGVGHLMIANLMTAWVNRDRSYALAPLGWAVLAGGGLLMWLGYMGAIGAAFLDNIGPGLMIVGAVLIFLFTSTRPVNSAKDAVLRVFDGLNAIYNVTGIFGDVLSYMRLFALGLSGASLAMTFNSLAMDVLNSSPVTGVLFAGIILLLGHLLNFALCIMSGVVHGMRLNVIEFVKWGLSDEGYPFTAFSKQED